MTKIKPNLKVQAFIWIALLWILFAVRVIELKYVNTTFNFDINLFGMVMVGLLLWGLDAINIYTMLAIFAFNFIGFFLPLWYGLTYVIPPVVIRFFYFIIQVYVIYRCFSHVWYLGYKKA